MWVEERHPLQDKERAVLLSSSVYIKTSSYLQLIFKKKQAKFSNKVNGKPRIYVYIYIRFIFIQPYLHVNAYLNLHEYNKCKENALAPVFEPFPKVHRICILRLDVFECEWRRFVRVLLNQVLHCTSAEAYSSYIFGGFFLLAWGRVSQNRGQLQRSTRNIMG